MSAQAQPVRIFIAYSTHDLAFKEEIRKRLKPLLRAGKVTLWDNWDIEAGANWDNMIQENLHQADLILLLLSPDALDSDYFYEVEAPIALRRHKAGEAITVGVLLRPCSFKHTPFEFEQYELLPKKGYPITDPRWANADEAYLTVVEEVDALVEKINSKRGDFFCDLMVDIKGREFDMRDTLEQLREDIVQIEQYLKDKNLTAQFTASGLRYIITQEGTGGHPTLRSKVTVRYKGYLLSGSVFDQTSGSATVSLPLANLIPGWQEGIPLLKAGGKGTFLIPSALCYGPAGTSSIPPNTPLAFDVELVSF